MTPESQVLRAITDLLTAERILFFRMNSGGMFGTHKGKRWAVKFGTPGMADVLAFVPAFSGIQPVWIEAKAGKGVQSAEQILFQARVVKEGHDYILAYSSDDVKAWLKEQ